MKEDQCTPNGSTSEGKADRENMKGAAIPTKDSTKNPVPSNDAHDPGREDNSIPRIQDPAAPEKRPPAGPHAGAPPTIFAAWEKYEGVAMHFNELLIRLRTQAIAGVAAIATVAAIIERGDIASNLRWDLLAASFFFLNIFWVAVWIIDVRYYNRLLRGAVDALLEIEAASKCNITLNEIILSTRIEEMFSKAGEKDKQQHDQKKQRQSEGGSSVWPVRLFYTTVFIGLILGLIVSVGGLLGYKMNVRPAGMPMIAGIVEDIQSGKPIKGAEVMLSSDQRPGDDATTITADDGSFIIKPNGHWRFLIVPLDAVPIPFKLSVQEVGYKPQDIHFPYFATYGVQTNNFKEVRLQAVTK
jgi:hypothetical protein